MLYVKFYGENALGYEYEDYMVFDDDYPKELLNQQAIEFAIENADAYLRFCEFRESEDYVEYLKESTEYASWKIITQEEFERALK